MKLAELPQYGLLETSGADARPFLHGQLTNDVQHLGTDRARHAGWCSAKGRLLASLLVVPQADGYLLQLARDLAPAVAKRLSMFVLRAKAKITDASDAWVQYGIWGESVETALAGIGLPEAAEDLRIVRSGNLIAVRFSRQRYLLIGPAAERAKLEGLAAPVDAAEWTLQEIRAGRPLIAQATQDQFVPQMVNYERLDALDFQKGCYPGQEIVARAQYRGQVKRRMVRLRGAAPFRAGQELFSDDLPGQASGTVVNAAADEALAVVPITALENGAVLRIAADAPPLEVLPLPYAA